MSKKNKRNGLTRQGVKDLNYIKGKSVGIRLELPPSMAGNNCRHPDHAMEYDHESGITTCKFCSCRFDFDGKRF